MNNKNMKTDFDLFIISRNKDDNVTLYISKSLLLDHNDMAKNIHITNKLLHNYDYFEMYINLNRNKIDIYKPHYIGISNGNLYKYIDGYIIELINKLLGKQIINREDI